MFKPKNWLDRVFEIGIIGKGLNGAAELVGGLLLLFLTPDRIHHLRSVINHGVARHALSFARRASE